MSSSNCCFLTCIQISQEAHKVVWYSHLFQTCCIWSQAQTLPNYKNHIVSALTSWVKSALQVSWVIISSTFQGPNTGFLPLLQGKLGSQAQYIQVVQFLATFFFSTRWGTTLPFSWRIRHTTSVNAGRPAPKVVPPCCVILTGTAARQVLVCNPVGKGLVLLGFFLIYPTEFLASEGVFDIFFQSIIVTSFY